MATPEATVPVPRVVVLSMKVTVPVGFAVLPEAPVMVAVKVMLAPMTAVVVEAESFVVVAVSTGAAFTVITSAEEVLPLKLVSPL